MRKLNLGCGNDIKEGYINVDLYNPKADIIWDLNKFPWPFGDNEFDEIYAAHILEHLNDTVRAMEEIWRISKRGAKVIIKVPHFSTTWFGNPTHVQAFGICTFNIPFALINNREQVINDRQMSSFQA
jgi:predicted SAM-dependent methyltransferase